MKLTESEEDHIRVIFYLFERTGQAVSTNAISDQINTTPASVTDMIKRLSSKGLVTYRKYYGVTLNAQGNYHCHKFNQKKSTLESYVNPTTKF